MRLFLVLLPFLGVVFCSAAPTDIEKRSAMVKRAQEVMMFGNQQNKPRIKKSDPDVPVLPDLEGSVTAHEAKNIAETKTAELPKAIEKELEDVSDDVTSQKDSDEGTSESNEPTTDELLQDFPPETAEALKELENAKEEIPREDESTASDDSSDETSEEKEDESDRAGENSSVQEMGDDEDMIEMLPEEWYSNPALALQLYRAYKKLPNYGYPYYRRRRRSLYKARMFTNEMKRSHRAKRDLPYTDEEYPLSYYPAKFGPSYTIDDLESYAREKEYEDNVLRAILDNVDPEDVEEIVHKGVMGLFIPLEEEEPVISSRKRSPNFYPYSEEPETHFGAFVPEKREYLDSYSRLVQLARELSKSEQSNEDEYQRW